MTRLLEFIVALTLVVVLAVVVGVLLPAHGRVQRSVEISHNLRHTYDILNNFRRFPDYSALRSYERDTQFKLSGPAYGVGGKIGWQGNSPKVGTGSLEIASNKLDSQIVWTLDNDWSGHNKRFTIDLEPSDNQKLVKINMSYDVDYGWNLIDRYSQLYLHGDPSSFMQYSLSDLQNMLAGIPNISYQGLDPRLIETPERPVLIVSTQAPRNLDDIATATDKALEQIHGVMNELGVKQIAPPITFTTDWGDQSYSFDVAVVIDSSKLNIEGKEIDLHDAPKPKSLAEQNLANASAAPAPSSSSEDGDMPPGATEPGMFDDDGTLMINDDVRAKLAFGGRALAADWHGSPVGLVLMRLALKADASTHGYDFNEYSDRFYDIVNSDPDKTAEDDQDFTVYLPVSDAPEQTPYQAANQKAATGSDATPVSGAPALPASAEPADESSAAMDSSTG